jgi:hypothetical protein
MKHSQLFQSIIIAMALCNAPTLYAQVQQAAAPVPAPAAAQAQAIQASADGQRAHRRWHL